MSLLNRTLILVALLLGLACFHLIRAQGSGANAPAVPPVSALPAIPTAPATLTPATPVAPPPSTLPAAPATNAPIVRAVQVTGFSQVSAAVQQQVANIVNTLKGQPYDEDRTAHAADDIQSLGWFVLVEHSQQPVEGGVSITLTVTENPIIDRIDIKGNISFSTEDLRTLIKTQVGRVMNENTAVLDKTSILAFYYKKGYTLTDVATSIENDNGLNVLVFEVFEPRISEIRIQGNTRTREYVIRRQLEIKPGDIYNKDAISRSLTNLDHLGIFQDETITQEVGTMPNTVRLNVVVVERRTGTASIGIAQTSNEGLTGFLDLADTNVFGSGQRLSLDLRNGAERSYDLSYTNPWIDPHKTSLTMNLYNRSILRQATVGDEGNFDYDEKRTGVNMSLGRPTGEHTRLYLGMRVDRISGSQDTTVTSGVTSLLGFRPAVQQAIYSEILAASDVRSLSLSSTFDTRWPFQKPYSGRYLTYSAEYAGFGGAEFTKFSAEMRRYFIVRRDTATSVESQKQPLHWVYATRLMAGTTTGNVPFLDQFFIGGADTMRGYRDSRFPGEHMTLWNNELRIPVNDTLDLVGFIDVGDSWGGYAASVFGDGGYKLHYSYGGGVRVQTPIGPLRLDYGINEAGGSEITYGVGQAF
jgi:outer membrane protein insertion porin family